jgi:stress response protein YsnF
MQPSKGDEAIPLVEEKADFHKRTVTTGKVSVRTVTETVEEIAHASLGVETVEVMRVPVGSVVDKAPAIRTEGDVTIVPVLKEELFVEKRLVLAEEIHIRRRTSCSEVEVPISLKKQRAVVERGPPEPSEPEK